MSQMTDIGVLRDRKKFSLNTHFIPLLYNQAEVENVEQQDRVQVIQDALESGLTKRANKHKNAILA